MIVRALALLVRPLFWAALFVLWAVSIAVLSSLSALPAPPARETLWEPDKVVHLAAYSIGAMFLAVALRLHRPRPAWETGAIAWFWMVIYALLDELHQCFVPNRTGLDLGDLLADTAGATAGVLIILLIYAGTDPDRCGFPDRIAARDNPAP